MRNGRTMRKKAALNSPPIGHIWPRDTERRINEKEKIKQRERVKRNLELSPNRENKAELEILRDV